MMKRIVFFLFFVCMASLCYSYQEVLHTGTLIVTYQTDAQGERIERIRFWLKDENEKQHLYPIGSGYVDDPRNFSRMVVIENLHPGKYKLEFLVPNTDGYFVEVPERHVVVAKGDVAKIDQKIKPRKTYWMKSAKSRTQHPVEKPKKVKKEDSPIAEKAEVPPVEKSLPYQPEPREIAFGKLIVSFEAKGNCSQVRNIRFKLVDDQGMAKVHPDPDEDTEIPLRSGNMVVVNDVPVGDYLLEFFFEGEEGQMPLPTKPITIEANKTKSIHQSLCLPETEPVVEKPSIAEVSTHTINIMANIPTAIYHLRNEEGTKQWNGKGRQYVFEGLAPGSYKLSFESNDPFFFPPEEILFNVAENERNEVEAVFNSLGKIKISANVEEAKVLIRNVDNSEDSREMEIIEGVGVAYLPEGEYRLIFSKSKGGNVPPQSVMVSISALHTKELNLYFAPSQ